MYGRFGIRPSLPQRLLLGLLGEKPGGPIVLDTFTDAPGTALAVHPPDIAPLGWTWTPFVRGAFPAPAWVIDGAGTRINPVDGVDGNFRGYQGNAGASDVRLSVDFEANPINPTWPGLVGRWTSSVDQFIAWWSGEANVIHLVDPSEAEVTASLALDVGDLARITLTMKGTAIEALFENLTQVLSDTLVLTSALNQLAPRHGLIARTAWNPAFDFYDNFLIEPA